MTTTPHPYKSERTDLFASIQSGQKTEATTGFRYPGFLVDEQELPDPEIEWIEERVVGGDRNVYQFIEGPYSFQTGSLTIVPYDGWPIAWLLGDDTVSGTGPYTHTITPKQTGKPPTATLEANYYAGPDGSDMSRAYVGCMPGTGSIEVNNEEELQLSLDVRALGLTADTYDDSRTPTTGVTLPDRSPWKFSKLNSDLSLFGTTFARLEDFTLDIDNQPTTERYIESNEAPEPYEVLYGPGDWSLTVDLAITDSAVYQELVGPTSGGFSGSIEFVKNTNETLNISLSDCQIPNAPHTIPEEGKILTSVEVNVRDLTITVDDSVGSTAYV